MKLGLFKPTPEKLSKALWGLKASLGALAVSQFANENSDLAFYLLIATGAIDFIGNMFAE